MGSCLCWQPAIVVICVQCIYCLCTHTHPFNSPFSKTTQVSQYQKGKTNLDFTEARDSEWQWHQLGHMQVCSSLQTDNHASTPPLSFLQAGCPSCRPTNSIKALKGVIAYVLGYNKFSVFLLICWQKDRHVWVREHCRISPPRFLAECCKRQLNQGSFVLLYFRLFTFSNLYWVCLSVFSCTVLFVSISQVIGCEDRLRNDLNFCRVGR